MPIPLYSVLLFDSKGEKVSNYTLSVAATHEIARNTSIETYFFFFVCGEDNCNRS